MKRSLCFLFACFFCAHSFSQPPSQAEIDKMMKQAKEAQKNIDAETKRMMDSMGIRLPEMKEMPKISDKQLAEAYEQMTATVPKKDAARIASVSKTPLTDATLPSFLAKTHAAVAAHLPANVRIEAEQIYQWAKAKNNSASAIGSAASGIWIHGKYRYALYLMGKAVQQEPSNADHLNNYAAFLTMCGAEPSAIPLLQLLNKKFPKNSTVLNNLGQAWFGLGDLTTAEKYIDSAILVYTMHSQANYTKCLLLENKGDKKGAAEAMKRSIKNSYSDSKSSKLNDGGHRVSDKDLRWNFPIPVDALGLERFFLPKYPKTTGESEQLRLEWKAFVDACNVQIKTLQEKNKQLETQAAEQTAQVSQELINAVANRQRISSVPLVPFYHSKAVKKLIYLIDDKDGSIQYNRVRIGKEKEEADKKVRALLKQEQDEMTKLHKDFFVTTIRGDGGISEEEMCSKQEAIMNKYLPKINKLYEDVQQQFLEFTRKLLNNTAYFNLFTMDPLRFEIYKNGAKASWLNEMAKSSVIFRSCPRPQKEEAEHYGHKLPDFDDLHCQYTTALNFFVGSFKMSCSRMTTKFEGGPVKLDIKENLNTGEIIRGTVEVGVSKGFGVEKGPVKGEVKLEAGVQIELDRAGVSDVIVKAAANVEAGSNVINEGPKGNETVLPPGVGDKSVTLAGVEVRYGWNSGGAVEGKGILKGMKY